MNLDWPNMVSIWTNTSAPVSAGMGLIALIALSAARWKVLQPVSKMLIFTFIAMYLAIIDRMLPWSIGMWLAEVGYRYHPVLIENKIWSYGPSAPLFLLGIWGSLLVMFPKKPARKWLWLGLGVTLFVSTFAAVTWQASELGYWFDRHEVISWVNEKIGQPSVRPATRDSL